MIDDECQFVTLCYAMFHDDRVFHCALVVFPVIFVYFLVQ